MDWETLAKITDLGTTLAVVAMFIWYLRDRNGKQEKAMNRVAKILEVQTRVLIRVARQHGHNNDADDLMEGVE